MARVKVTEKDEQWKAVGTHALFVPGEPVPPIGDGIPPLSIIAQLAPWITGGIIGELTLVRPGAETMYSGGMTELAMRLSLGCDGDFPALVRDASDIVGNPEYAACDIRYYLGAELPGPSGVVQSLASLTPRTELLFAPVPIRVGVGAMRHESGQWCVIVVCMRHAVPRKPRRAKAA